ncbi:MAG TPA: hypothetical protein PLC52_04480 [Anaerolineales bacterium]|nr:hypothetical protein [Anaerolineales bacterium]HRQ92107.1 hypothetical protein [Anaerolineales bacterium]
MANHALFSGLVVDEFDQPVDTTHIGQEAFYIVNDQGFMRHIASEDVDRAVLRQMGEMLAGHEEELSKQAAQMMGQDDIFTQAAILNQLKNVDEQFDQVLAQGLPEASRTYLGMSGFKVRINLHGEVLEVIQPGQIASEDED